jgi:hypothetical protein
MTAANPAVGCGRALAGGGRAVQDRVVRVDARVTGSPGRRPVTPS